LHVGHLQSSQLNRFQLQPGIDNWKKRYTPATFHHYVKVLRAFLLWNERFANGQRGLRESIRRPALPLPRTIYATDEERERMLQMANPGLRFFILLCADLGLRHKTALSIAPHHYNADTKTITFTTKGGHQQVMPVTPEIAHSFQFIPPGADKAAPMVAILNRHTTHSGRKGSMQDAYKRLRAAAEVRPEVRIHDLRRSAAEAAWAATKDLRAVQALLGHTSIATTNRYLHNRTQPEQLRHTIDAMNAIRERHTQKSADAHDTSKTERTQ